MGHGVIGSTIDFDSVRPGSSPGAPSTDSYYERYEMKVEINKLHGLGKVANGYFYDTVTGDVTSTRQYSFGSKMSGSRSHGVKRYTFMLAGVYKTGYTVSVSVAEYDLRAKVAMYSNSIKTSPIGNKATAVAPMEKGWIIGSFNLGVLSVADHPKVHTTEASVKAEMVRLATSQPGRTFVQMKVEGFVKAGGVQWS